MEIKRSGSQPSRKGPAEYFTGGARGPAVPGAPDPARVSGGSVTFEPGARTAWHTHPLGQTLIVTSGFAITESLNGEDESADAKTRSRATTRNRDSQVDDFSRRTSGRS